MRFDIITIFPNFFDSFTKESLLKRAQTRKLLSINVHNLRNWSSNKHNSVDDKPFGGGLGMVMKIEPIYKAVEAIKKKKKVRVILFTPRGKKFTQKMASEYAKYDQLIFICGRYEGVDERIAKYVADEEVSIGDYVLMGGEVPAMAVIETVSRLIPGVVGRKEFLKERISKIKGRGGNAFIEYPQYTRPEVFEPKKGTVWKVPKVLMSGDHKLITKWKDKRGKVIGK